MSDRPTTEPRTEAGRRLAEADAQALWSPAEVRDAILAIEAEAAQGAAPLRCPCPDHVGPENAHPLSESAAPHHCDCTWRDNPNIWAAPPACDGSCYNDPDNCLHTEGAAPRAEGLDADSLAAEYARLTPRTDAE